MTPITPITFDGQLPRLAIRRRRLPCGLEVVIHGDESTPQTAVSVTYRVGNSDERPDRTGFAHLFEHLFKSSPERLGGHHHYDVLKRAGSGEANASTSPDRTAYHEVVPSNQLALALWLESERMGYFLPDFDAARLATQQAVVRSERRQRYEDVPYGAERFQIGYALYPEGHPLRHGTIGRHEDIQAATVDDVADFYRTWYVPANATLVIAGDGDPAEIDALVDRYFGGFPASTRPVRPTPALPPITPMRERVVDKFAALARIHRVWPGPAAFAEGEADLDIATSAWTAIGTGPLWRRLVYEAQLAQRVSAWASCGRLGGEVHVAVDLRTGADPDRVRAILDEECTAPIEAPAIQRVITRHEAGTIWSLTGIARRAAMIQRFMLYTDEPDGLAAELASYQAVTPETIRQALGRWLARPYVEIETVPMGPALAA